MICASPMFGSDWYWLPAKSYLTLFAELSRVFCVIWFEAMSGVILRSLELTGGLPDAEFVMVRFASFL